MKPLPDLKYLVVDDREHRFLELMQAGFVPRDAQWAADAFAAQELLRVEAFDVIYLDHDLETFEHSPYRREVTGLDVARVIAAQPWRPALVVVHSMNPRGAATILELLDGKGIAVIKAPFEVLIATAAPSLFGAASTSRRVQEDAS